MIFSGNNYLSLSDQTGISFNIDLSINNLYGTCNLGFTGGYKRNFANDGLILHLDASNPNSYSGDSAWNDLSTNNCDYTLINNPTFDIDGGGSISFNGINQYGINNTVVANKLFLFNQDYTIEILAKVSALPTQEYSGGALFGQRMGANQLIFVSGKDQNNQSSLAINYDDTRYYPSPTNKAPFTNKKISPNEWFHFTIVNRNSGNVLPDTYTLYTSYYMNGLLDFSGSAGDGNGTDNPNGEIPTYIARQGRVDANISAMYTTGKFALIRAYNRALNSSEIFENYMSIRDRIYPENFNFKFNNGKIFDPENRLVYFYDQNENVNISGNISANKFSYYINDNLICLNGNKNSYTITGYYINTSNCTTDSEIKILGTQPAYSLNLSPIFYITGTNYLTGSINNSNNLEFKIYSGSITVPTGFEIQNLSDYVINTGIFSINHYNLSQNQVEDERLYEIQLNLFTNFGQITQNFTTTGSYSGYVNVNLNLNDITDYFIRSGVQTAIGDYKENNYILNFDIISGSLRSPPSGLNKNLFIKFEYSGGKTGEITGNINSSGSKNFTLTGVLSGSGYLYGTTSLATTGYQGLSGVNITGYVTGSVQDYLFVTGNVSMSKTLSMTGYYLNKQFVDDKNFVLNTFTSNGYINYNSTVNKIYTQNIQSFAPPIYPNYYPTFISSNDSGTILIVGNDSVLPNYSGRVLFLTGNGAEWILSREYSGIFGDNNFASQLKINRAGNTFAINSFMGNDPYTGRVYILTGYNQTLYDAQIIQNSGKYFGRSLALNSGNILVIGNQGDNNNSGSANIYKKYDLYNKNVITGSDSTNYQQKTDNFGLGMTFNNNGDKLFISARNKGVGTDVYGTGSIFIFTGNGNNWNPYFEITGDSSVKYLGRSLAINSGGNIIMASAIIGQSLLSGLIYAYTGSDNNYVKVATFSGSQSDGSQFGSSISLNASGTVAVIGGYTYSGQTGAAWIFTGNGSSWAESARLTQNKYAGQFGYSTAISDDGNTIAIGQPYYGRPTSPSSNLLGTGAVVIYTGNGSNWAQAFLITGDSDTKYRWGNSISMNSSGNMVLIGLGNSSPTSSAFLYTGNGSNWALAKRFINPTYKAFWGNRVNLNKSGNQALISSMYDSDDGITGAVYFYTGNLNNWSLANSFTGQLINQPSFKSDYYNFGINTAINPNGKILTIASSASYGSAISQNDPVSIFSTEIGWTKDQWKQISKISGNSNISTAFGFSSDITNTGNVIIIGSPSGTSGTSYIFTGDYNNYNLLSSLRGSGNNISDDFGCSVSLNQAGNIAAIGAKGYNSNRGGVYIFTGNQNGWAQSSFISGNVNNTTYFGNKVILNKYGNLLAIGAPYDDLGFGVIYIYTGNQNTWTQYNKINQTNLGIISCDQLGNNMDFINFDEVNTIFANNYIYNRVHVFSDINFSGYISDLVATGFVSKNANYLFTGLITGQKYTKSFFDAFDISTGYYSNGFLTGVSGLNKDITNNRYTGNAIINIDTNRLYVVVKSRNYFNNQDDITGILTLSGYNDTNKYKSVIISGISHN
jgi:hypothetical protein